MRQWFLVATLAVVGCSSAETPATSGDAGTTTDTAVSTTLDTAIENAMDTSVDTAVGTTVDGAAAAGRFTAKLAIPGTFTGEPTKLVVAAFSKLPVAGPPDGGILLQVASPKLTAGGSFAIDADLTGITGKYYVLSVVYMKGGGTFSPKDGVDYDVATTTALDFDGKTSIDAGSLSLAVHHSGDGH